jgi:CHAT domain-containing protein
MRSPSLKHLLVKALSCWYLCAFVTQVHSDSRTNKEELSATSSFQTLSRESCELRPRTDVASSDGLPPDSEIRCSGRSVGSLIHQRSYDSRNGLDLDQARDNLLNGSAWKVLAQRVTCGNGIKLQETVFAFGCRSNVGGFPHLVTLSLRDSIIRIADGPPIILPTLLAVAAGPANRKLLTPLESQDYFKRLFNRELNLASVEDLDDFKLLLRQAKVANANGDFQDAEQQLSKALSIQLRLLDANDPTIANTILDLALNISNQGRDEETLDLFRRVEPLAQQSTREADRARFASFQAYHAANLGRYEQALKFSTAAVSAWRKLIVGPNLNFSIAGAAENEIDPRASEKGELALSLNLQANMALRAEEIELAEASASEALRLLDGTKGLPSWWKPDVLVTLGKISSAKGRLSAAETYLQTALEIRRFVSGDGAHNIPILIALAGAYQREAMNTSAIITYREIFKLIKFNQNQGFYNLRAEDLIPYGRAVIAYANALTDDSQRQGLFAEAFDAFQLFRSGAAQQTLLRASELAVRKNEDLANTLSLIKSAERTSQFATLALNAETSLPDDQRSKLVEERLASERNLAEQKLQSGRQILLEKFPSFIELLKPKALDLLAIRQRLNPREGLLAFLIGENESFVQLIRRDGIEITRSSLGRNALNDRVSQIRKAFDVQAGAPADFNLEASFDLYQGLLGPLRTKLQGLEHLIVIGTGPLASLPFSVLVDSRSQTSTHQYNQVDWLGQRFELSHAASIEQFYKLRTFRSNKQAVKGMLAFANPILLGKSAQKAHSDGSSVNPTISGMQTLATSCRQEGPAPSELLRALDPLPETSIEVRQIDALLKRNQQITNQSNIANDIFLGDEASEARLRAQDLSSYRILYFATHGLLPGELKCQAEPGLVLTPPPESSTRDNDGLLEASEIASMQLNAELVVLSACNTATSGFGGDTLSGLAQAFSFAGARNLLVSHWQVPSTATAQLMTSFFSALGDDNEPSQARSLQIAQASLIKNVQTSHPYFWGAFVLMGDGQADRVLPIPRASP